MRERLAVDDALAAVLAAAPGGPLGGRPLRAERVALGDALGRVLAADVRAGWDVPPRANASMDGYAVRAADAAGARPDAPARLRVVGEAPAGRPWGGTVGAGEAVRIATGAPVPAGADAVVRVEDTDAADDGGTVLVRDGRDARETDTAGGGARRNVRPAGEDLRAGSVAARAGTAVTPGVVGVLAAAGAAHVDVVRRPRVAIVASGDELVALDDLARARAGDATVNANAPALAALVRAAGGEPVDLGVAPDTPEGVRARIAAARDAGCDVVLTSGGVSVGPRDLVRPAVEALGGRLDFWRVRMRPGGPLAFGTLPAPDGTALPWFGLPGNPVSTVVTFAVFVRPLLRALAGDARPFRRVLRAAAGEPLRTAAPLTHFLRVTLATDDAGGLVARLTGPQGSGLLSSVAAADALAVVPAGAREVPAGAPVRILPLGGDALAGDPFACADRPSYEGT
ncbi:molybdopterin molybdenumtransferase MoeA [Gemmatimonadetes bacterium T265]|nr:molybdopterin molybdenumtransferase MoeA [Gemmatimonadetes bacterium T265]